MPTCADGAVYFRTYSWAGGDFFTELCTLAQRPTVPVQATPGAGGTIVGEIPAGTCGVQSNVADWSIDNGWFAVYFGDRSGWSPVDAFELPPAEPPWPADENPFETATSTTPPPVPPPPPAPAAAPPPCDSYSFNEDYPIRRCDEGFPVMIIQQVVEDVPLVVEVGW